METRLITSDDCNYCKKTKGEAMKCDGRWNGYYIEASEELWDKLLDDGYKAFGGYEKYNGGYTYIVIDKKGYIDEATEHFDISRSKPLYLVNGEFTETKGEEDDKKLHELVREKKEETISITDEHGKEYKFEKPEFEIKSDKGNKVTKKGLIGRIYSTQKDRCKLKGVALPTYSLEWLANWLRNQDLFHILYQEWVDNDYEKMLKPSIDRLNDYESYTESNIRLTTWEDNCNKHYSDRKNGINNKHSKAVVQLNPNGSIVEIHYSISEAERVTGIGNAEISKCLNGYRNRTTAGGYGWRLATKDELMSLYYDKE